MHVTERRMLEAVDFARDHWLEAVLADHTTRWHSFLMDDEQPVVERIWTQMDDEFRVAIHRILPVPAGSAPLFHWHRWPAGFFLLDGSYRTGIGHGPPGDLPPEVTRILECHAGDRRVMIDPNEWHWVSPLRHSVISIMVFGRPYPGVPERVAKRPTLALPRPRIENLLWTTRQLYGMAA